jgi:hypothetical protein
MHHNDVEPQAIFGAWNAPYEKTSLNLMAVGSERGKRANMASSDYVD